MTLFDITGFVPRWTCGRWTEVHGWAHIISDVLIFSSYLGIPLSIIYVVLRRKQIFFPRLFWLFAAFIFFCGIGHLVEAIIFWHPVYRFAGFIKVITAVVSILTLVAVIKILPKLIVLPSLIEVNEELKQLNRELNEKQHEIIKANQHKNIFLANMSHELKTPLNSIMVLSSLLLKNEENILDKKSLDSIEVINKSGGELLNLISDILDLVKIEAGKIGINKEIFSITKLISDLEGKSRLLIGDKEVKIIVEVEEDVPAYVFSDYSKIRQIMYNFANNAIKFTDDEGCIVLGAEMHENKVSFFVEDTGVGITKECLKDCFHVFEKGASENISGTGIGLSISKKIATLIDCTIRVETEVNVGSKFILELPDESIISNNYGNKEDVNQIDNVLENKYLIDNNIEVLKIEALSGKTVLIFNQDVLGAFYMSSMLSSGGMLPEIAKDVSDIAGKIGRKEYSVALFDLDSLKDTDVHILKQVFNLYSNVPTLILSSEDVDESIRNFGGKFIKKPIQSIELFQAIEELILGSTT